MNSLLIKIVLMPLVIAMVTFASRRWGQSLAGQLASLPWVAGPIILFLALERGAPFAVQTIPGVMVGIIGWLAFCMSYIAVGQRYGPLFAALASYVVYLIPGLIISLFHINIHIHVCFVVTMLANIATLLFFPGIRQPIIHIQKSLAYDIPLRMVAVTLFVIAITYFANSLGPTWSGILTPFPVMTSVLAIFTHYTQGIAATRLIIRGLLIGIFGFTVFLYLQYFLLASSSIVFSFVVGFTADLFINIAMAMLMKRYGRTAI